MTDKKNIRLAVLAFFIMFIFGFVMNLKGVSIPSIKREFNVSYESIGIMILIGDIGYIIATFLAGIAGERVGIKRIFIIGFIISVLSIICLIFVKSFLVVLVLMFFMASGFGCFEVGLNSLGAQIFLTNTAVLMNFLHFFYGVGSSVGPKYAGFMIINNISWKSVYVYSLAIILLVFIFLIITPFPPKNQHHDNLHISLKDIVSDLRVWLFIGILGFGIAVEVGIGNWFTNYLQVMYSMNEDSSSVYLSLFFIAFTVGRIVGGMLTEKVGYIRIMLYFTSFTLALILMGLSMGKGFIILFSLTGFFISIMYPTIITAIIKEYPSGTTAVMGFIITVAGAVNMITSWLIGRISDYFGVFAGFSSILIYAALIIVLLFIINKKLLYKGRVQS